MRSRVHGLCMRVKMMVFQNQINIRVDHDNESEDGRVFVQTYYFDKCRKTGKPACWYGRKYYLSRHMTDDEIIKTLYVAFEACVRHEVMEGFTVDGKVLFNPHVNYEELLKISDREVCRV